MFDLDLTLDLYYVPLMDEAGFGISVSRYFELPLLIKVDDSDVVERARPRRR